MWHDWSRLKRWLVALAAAGALLLLALAGTLYHFLHIPGLPLPPGVTKQTERVSLTGKSVKVDFYLPSAPGPAPVVVIAQGFTRNRKTMACWGGMLAAHGFLAMVPDLPTWADHARNGRALAELLVAVRAGKRNTQPKPGGAAALVGFSAGGLSTLLAAEGNTNVACWVGLDPVAAGPTTTRATQSLHNPCIPPVYPCIPPA